MRLKSPLSAHLGFGSPWDGRVPEGEPPPSRGRGPHASCLAGRPGPGASPACPRHPGSDRQAPRTSVPASAAQPPPWGPPRRQVRPEVTRRGQVPSASCPRCCGRRRAREPGWPRLPALEPGGRPAGAVFLSGNLPPRVPSCHRSVSGLQSLGIWRGGSFREL